MLYFDRWRHAYDRFGRHWHVYRFEVHYGIWDRGVGYVSPIVSERGQPAGVQGTYVSGPIRMMINMLIDDRVGLHGVLIGFSYALTGFVTYGM
jgi:hypothetical protein